MSAALPIPVLTSYGLPLGYMGDILGGGFLLSLASFVVAAAAAETGSPYAQLGSSRAKTFSAITEPVVLFVVFTVALLTGTDLPYALAATVRSSARQVIRPAHLRQLPARPSRGESRLSVLTLSEPPLGISDGVTTWHGTPIEASSRYSS